MTLDTFFKKFDQFADAPDAVAKMRELVLQLAMQGKLVSQNPKDEDASTLLTKIGKTKELLISKRAIRRQDTAPIDVEDAPFNVPQSWIWTRLGEIADWGSGSTPSRGNSDLYDGGIAWLKSGELNDNQALAGSEETVTEKALATGSFRRNQPGDVLLAMYGATIGKVAILAEPAVTNQAVCGCTPFEGVFNRYLFFYILSQRARFHSASEGGAQPNISKVKIVAFPFPLPPLAEQKRIVAKVDELMALCDRLEAQQQERGKQASALARASLARFAEAPTPANLNLLFHKDYSIPPGELRKAILAMAVQGKLLPQDPKEESAEKLIARLEEDRAGLAKKQGVRPPKDVPMLKTEDHPHNIPKTWKWSRIGHLALVIDYGTSQKSHGDSSKIPVYRMGNIVGGRLIDENLKYVDPTIDDLPKLYLKTNDILFNRTNSYELVGKSGIFTGQDDTTTFASYLIRIRLPSTLLFPTYFSVAMNAPYFRQTQIEPEVVQQCGQANFNGTKLSSTVVPVPPLAEQYRIVAKVDQLMALVDQLETQLATSRATAKNLLEALVAEITMR
jgi:type I restriction enzyme S subunit